MYSRTRNVYKKSAEYFTPKKEEEISYSAYDESKYNPQEVIEKFEYIKENSEEIIDYQDENKESPITMQFTTKKNVNTASPQIWGPSLWFTLHVGASRYPIKANQITKDRMKGFIMGIPYILPCIGCKPHAIAYIESKRADMDKIVSGREELVKFFVDFHNKVNDRYGKKKFTYEDAVNMYEKGMNITHMNYF